MKSLALVVGVSAGLIASAWAVRAAMAARWGSAVAGGPAEPPAGDGDGEPAGPVAVPAPTEQALSYHRSGNVIWVSEQLLGIALPLLLLFTGLSARLRTFAAAVARGHLYPTLVIYLVVLAVAMFLVELPLSYYVGYVREHAYGLSTQRLSKWTTDPVSYTHLTLPTKA